MKTKHRTAARAKQRWHADPMAFARVLGKVMSFSHEEIVRLETPVRLAFERIKAGTAPDDDFDTLSAAINVAMVRSERIDPHCLQSCQLAQDALMRTYRFFQKTGKWCFDGPALFDVPPAIDIYSELLRLCTPLEMQGAMTETIKRMNAGATL